MDSIISLTLRLLLVAAALQKASARIPGKNHPRLENHTPPQTRLVDGKHQVNTVTLFQGQDMKFGCISDDNAGNAATLSLYPSDPRTRTLMPLDESDFESSIRREVLLRDISRSTNLQIGYEKTGSGTGIVKVAYPKNALIMARDPENFSLNFACKYEPKDKSLEPIYRWVKVTFKHVYPLAYGCESGNNMLFKNSVPKMPWLPQQAAHPCEIKPEPGMIFGIYCQPDERLVPENCLTHDALYYFNGVVKMYLLPEHDAPRYPDYTVSSRLKLFKVSNDLLAGNINIRCACINRHNEETVALHLISRAIELYDPTERLREFIPSEKWVMRSHLANMEPGSNFSFSVFRDKSINLRNFGRIESRLLPEKPLLDAYNTPPSPVNTPSPIIKFIGSKGFRVANRFEDKKVKYTLDYDKNAVVVQKTTVPYMYYKWNVSRTYGTAKVSGMYRLDVNIIPTDPYTYGCGVDSLDLFRSENVKLEILEGGVTSCTVNPYVTSPVGFYCPKGYEMVPTHCFTHMVHNDTRIVESLSTYAPLARPVNGKHISAVDFTAPHSLKHLVKYSNDRLSCMCRDDRGTVRAVITLDLRHPSKFMRKRSVSEMEDRQRRRHSV